MTQRNIIAGWTIFIPDSLAFIIVKYSAGVTIYIAV